jgi:putative heme iron utilization protein
VERISLSAPAVSDPAADATSPAQDARKLVRAATSASLGTRGNDGSPFVSLVAIVDDGSGHPLFLLSGLAEHTRNLRVRPQASVLIAADASGTTMDRARVTLTGGVRWLEGADADRARQAFVAARAEAKVWAALPDFAPARLEVHAVHWVGGFARAPTISVAAYLAAVPS